MSDLDGIIRAYIIVLIIFPILTLPFFIFIYGIIYCFKLGYYKLNEYRDKNKINRINKIDNYYHKVSKNI